MGAISGLTFIAYKHPEGYQKLFNFLYFFAFLIYATIGSWSASGSYLWSKIDNELTKEQIKTIEPIFTNVQFPVIETNLIFWGFSIYLLFLSFLPNLLEQKK